MTQLLGVLFSRANYIVMLTELRIGVTRRVARGGLEYLGKI